MKSGTSFLKCFWVSCVLFGAAPVVMAQSAPETWRFTLGLGALYKPKYPGSDDHKVRAVPILSANYGRYFIGGVPNTGIPVGAGLFLVQEDKLRVGLGVGRQIGRQRKESDSRSLRGLGDVDATTLGAVFASYTDDWFTVRGYVATDLGNNDQGTRASFDLEGRYHVNEKLMLFAGPGATWADGDYTQTFFGIDEAQSLRSGKRQYSASSGLYSVDFGIGAHYRIDPNWAVRARFNSSQLKGDAADSPITERKSQNSLMIFSTYSF